MLNIYSNKDAGLLLSIIRMNEIDQGRINLSDSSEYLQVAAKDLKKGKIFPPHRHNMIHREMEYTQETWIVIQGRIHADFYDVDDSIVHSTELLSGDCAVAFRAGHGFEVLEDDTVLYEIKTGPYYGVEKDKTYIQ